MQTAVNCVLFNTVVEFTSSFAFVKPRLKGGDI